MLTDIIARVLKLFNPEPQKKPLDVTAKDRSGISSYYSYFVWKRCFKCKAEFRRSKGYKIDYRKFGMSIRSRKSNKLYCTVFVCPDCCPDIKTAVEYKKELELPPPKPPPPPPPPPRRPRHERPGTGSSGPK